MIKREAEICLKYKDVTIEIWCVWKLKTKMLPVIREKTGAILKSESI